MKWQKRLKEKTVMTEEQGEEEKYDTDFYQIRSDWEAIKKLINENEEDIDKLLHEQGYNASIRARNQILSIQKMCTYIRKSILLQRRDNKSNYYDK